MTGGTLSSHFSGGGILALMSHILDYTFLCFWRKTPCSDLSSQDSSLLGLYRKGAGSHHSCQDSSFHSLWRKRPDSELSCHDIRVESQDPSSRVFT